MLSVVSSLGVVKHHKAQNHYGIFCFGCQHLFARNWKTALEAQEDLDNN